MKIGKFVSLFVLITLVSIQGTAFASSLGGNTYNEHYDFSMLEPGDIIFGYSPSVAWIIPGHWTHVMIFVGWDSNGTGWFIEAYADGVHLRPLSVIDHRYPEIAIGRVMTTEKVKEEALAFMLSKLGDPYDYAWWHKEIDNGRYYCSELAWAGYYVAGIDIDEHPGFSWKYLWGVAPQEIYDDSHVDIISVQYGS